MVKQMYFSRLLKGSFNQNKNALHCVAFFKADIGDSVYTKISSLKQHHDAVKTRVTWMRQHAFCKILLFNVRNSLFMLLVFV